MAGLLDVFAIGFNSEGLRDFEQNLKRNERELDKYEKEVTSLEKKLEDLKKAEEKDEKAIKATKAALESASNSAKSFGNAVKTMKNQSEYQLLQLKKNFANLTKTVGMLAAVGVTIKKSLDFYEQGEQLDFLAGKTGIAVDNLQKLGNAAKRFGGSTEGIAGTLENLRSQNQDIKAGKGNEEQNKNRALFSDDPEQTLENVARKMETLQSDVAKWDLANSLGIDEGTTRMLIQGVDRYREALKRANKYKLYTKEDLERMREYRQVSGDIRMGIESIFGAIYRHLLPGITAVAKAIRGVTDWLAEHEGAVKIAAVFIGISAAIMGVVAVVNILNIAIGFLMANPVILTIVAIVAAITALIVIIQDLIVFIQGGDSIIGEILKKMGVDTDKLRENLKNFFNSLVQWIKSTIDWFKSLGGKVSDFIDQIKKLWDALPDPIKKLIGFSNPITGTIQTVQIAQNAINKTNSNNLNAVPAGAMSTYNQTDAITQNNNANNINNSKNSKNTVNIGTVNVQSTATNSEALAKDLMNPLSDIDNGLRL